MASSTPADAPAAAKLAQNTEAYLGMEGMLPKVYKFVRQETLKEMRKFLPPSPRTDLPGLQAAFKTYLTGKISEMKKDPAVRRAQNKTSQAKLREAKEAKRKEEAEANKDHLPPTPPSDMNSDDSESELSATESAE